MTRRTRLSAFVAITVLTLTLSATAYGQYETERFIPIGQSPGVSGKYSVVGQIVAIDEAENTITVAGPDGNQTLRVTDDTDVWIDRSGSKRKNLHGSRADCSVGRRVEVMHVWNDRSVARWIKIAE